MGYAVDRFGPRRMLIMGLCLSGVAYGSIGVFPVYPWLIGAAVIAGIANSVYHPSDYAILGSVIDPARVGRAFSIHTFSGFFGGAIAPTVMLVVATTAGIPRRADLRRIARPLCRGAIVHGARARSGRAQAIAMPPR